MSKILNIHPIDLKFEEDLYFRSLNSMNRYFFLGQRKPIGQHRPVSKIVNFHPIDLKFEEDLHIWSLNSTTNYFFSSNLFYGFCKCRALHDVFFVCLSVCRISQKVVDGLG